jgi:hypothetical protein
MMIHHSLYKPLIHRFFFTLISALVLFFTLGCNPRVLSDTDDTQPELPVPPDSSNPEGSMHGLVLYVAADGRDSNPGTAPEEPLASVSRALSLIKASYRQGNWQPGQSAVIRISGTLSAQGSFGANKSMIDISGAGNYPPLILEGDPLTGGVLNAGRTLTNQGRVLYIANNKVTLGSNLTLTGGNELWGGAVLIGAPGTPSEGEFLMNGGEISGNFGYAGSAVMVYKGSFEMTGGTIKNNYNEPGGTSAGIGGGVCVESYTVFTLSGGTISANGGNNTASGGGVAVNGLARFIMTGGEISANTVSDQGGGVSVSPYGEFEMSGGNITGNTAGSKGGGVYAATAFSAQFIQTGGIISGNLPGDIAY